MNDSGQLQTSCRQLSKRSSSHTRALSCWLSSGEFRQLEYFNLIFLVIYETILFVKDKGGCITNDKLHAHNARSSSIYQLYVHKLEIRNCMPTTTEADFIISIPHLLKETNKAPFLHEVPAASYK
jgi:hypothetical protein